jgi:hypothetical protein
MAIKNIIESIAQKHHESGIDIYPPATLADIKAFEQKIGFALPADFKEFYSICNGLGCNEDIFNIISLADITRHTEDYGSNWFYFSEYMIYSDMWGLRLTADGVYEIFNGSYPAIAMTSSFEEFLGRFLKGNVFETGGLYDWHNELKINCG